MPVNPLTLIEKMFGLALSKRNADAFYTNLKPSLDYILTTKGIHSVEARGLLEAFANLPASGAKRNNFVKRYITPPNGWKELPAKPEQIPFGFWH